MKYLYITFILFLAGCGSIGGKIKGFADAITPEYSPEQIEAIGKATSSTEIALSYFVLGGLALVLTGIVMLITPMKHAGIILIAGGAACGFTGYIIEEYAHYALITGLAAGLTYGGFMVGNKWGFKLGFQEGKGEL